MSFFQQSVLNKYLAHLNNKDVLEGYEKFKTFFHNPVIQSNIKEDKEEQFQEGFLIALFGNILGYTMNPFPDFNLTTELKNETGAKKADGAILKDNKAIGVIELKGTYITELNKITDQGFSYKNNQANCVYVITSNFEKLRFYIHNATDHLEFPLFTLTENEFRLLWLCLHKENIFAGIPEKIKEESISAEKKITELLYADYSVFKSELSKDLKKNNPEHDKLILYKKSQKLLDRLLFIFFSEDKGLLPPNSIKIIIKQWEELKERDAYVPLYDRLKKYFGYMNEGWKGKDYEIFAYNGGLFQPDDLLDKVIISDEVLEKHFKKLAEYDFASEVDVNILGHIFEHSLSEIDSITAELEGREHDESTSKKKKDGVFYTPKYITKYIVENTIGKLCEEKKIELGIIEEEFAKGRKNRKKEIIKLLDKKLKEYREWLLEITICDPACGSGAFLNQALDFLINEHTYIDELQSMLLGGTIHFPNIENYILENNLYGVDINEESIEIARLSLWLRTAQKGRKLSSLNNNIRCGNSLIDDIAVAFLKAFNWQKEFPDVFAKGGFDVVIGNPPYVRADSPGNTLEFREYLVKSNRFETLSGKWDLYIPFIEQSVKLTNENGKISLIIPDAYCHADYANKSLHWLKENDYLYQIDYYPEFLVFENVGVKSVIINCQKNKFSKFNQRIHHNPNNYSETVFDSYPTSMRLDSKPSIINNKVSYYLLNQICYSTKGIVGNSDEKEFQGEFEVGDLLSDVKDQTHPKLYFEGKDIGKWFLMKERWIEYGTERSPSKWSRKGFTQLFEGSNKLVAMRSPGYVPRIMLDENNGYFNESAIGFKRWIDLKGVNNKSLKKSYDNETERKEFEKISSSYSYFFLLAILNSSLIKYELNTNRRSNIHIYPEDWKVLNIPVINKENLSIVTEIEVKAKTMLSVTKQVQTLQTQFTTFLQSKYTIKKLSSKLQALEELEFGEFLKELTKAKINLTITEQGEWLQYFTTEKQKALSLQTEINNTNKEIDKMVYQLYKLPPDEIKIVEQNN